MMGTSGMKVKDVLEAGSQTRFKMPEFAFHSYQQHIGQTLEAAVQAAEKTFRKRPTVIFVLLPDQGNSEDNPHIQFPAADWLTCYCT